MLHYTVQQKQNHLSWKAVHPSKQDNVIPETKGIRPVFSILALEIHSPAEFTSNLDWLNYLLLSSNPEDFD